uniref:BTB domain-containing protein n=1 Tax=Steinernema glaseri TaxID=37863 RepID=A0A1I7YKF7_9BILA
MQTSSPGVPSDFVSSSTLSRRKSRFVASAFDVATLRAVTLAPVTVAADCRAYVVCLLSPISSKLLGSRGSRAPALGGAPCELPRPAAMERVPDSTARSELQNPTNRHLRRPNPFPIANGAFQTALNTSPLGVNQTTKPHHTLVSSFALNSPLSLGTVHSLRHTRRIYFPQVPKLRRILQLVYCGDFLVQ